MYILLYCISIGRCCCVFLYSIVSASGMTMRHQEMYHIYFWIPFVLSITITYSMIVMNSDLPL